MMREMEIDVDSENIEAEEEGEGREELIGISQSLDLSSAEKTLERNKSPEIVETPELVLASVQPSPLATFSVRTS